MIANMSAHYSQITAVIRFYQDKKNYENRDTFDGVVNVLWLDDKTAMLCSALGASGARRLKEVVDILKKQGADKIIAKRAKNRHMPKPWNLVKIGRLEDEWELLIN